MLNDHIVTYLQIILKFYSMLGAYTLFPCDMDIIVVVKETFFLLQLFAYISTNRILSFPMYIIAGHYIYTHMRVTCDPRACSVSPRLTSLCSVLCSHYSFVSSICLAELLVTSRQSVPSPARHYLGTIAAALSLLCDYLGLACVCVYRLHNSVYIYIYIILYVLY